MIHAYIIQYATVPSLDSAVACEHLPVYSVHCAINTYSKMSSHS